MSAEDYNFDWQPCRLPVEEISRESWEFIRYARAYGHNPKQKERNNNEPIAALRSDPDKRNYIVSNERLKEAGFEAKRSLENGILELLKGYRMLGRGPFGNV